MSNQDSNNPIPDDFFLSVFGGTIYNMHKVGNNYDGAEMPCGITETWKHLVAIYDGTESKIYLDGVLGNTKTVTATLTGFNKNIILGYSWKGLIDELYIYNRAITQAEVTQLYNLK